MTLQGWHYQVMKHVEPDGEVWHGVHEYYPFCDGYTEEPILSGEDLEDIKQILKMIEQDIYRHGVKDYEV